MAIHNTIDNTGRYIPTAPQNIEITYTDYTGSPIKLDPYTQPYITLNYPPAERVDGVSLTPPKCYSCGKEVESISSFVQDNTLVVILRCHGEERRIDVQLKRFKGDTEDAIEWFSDNFQWAFDEEEKWRKVQPDKNVSTVHADSKILTDWLDKL